MVTVLTDEEVESLIQLSDIADVVEQAQIKQDADAVERPDRPHFPIGNKLEGTKPLGTGLVMPAYIHGTDFFATKLVSVYEENPEKGLPTLHSQLVLSDAHNGQPVAFMNANTIINIRTGCIGGLAVRELANKPVKLAVIGAGAQARWQTRAVDTLCELASVSIYSPSDSKYELADQLSSIGISTHAAESPDSAVRNANTVITATTSPTPVFSAEAIQRGTLIVGIGAFQADMQELAPAVFDKTNQVFADVPEEAAEIGDIRQSSLTKDQLVQLGEVFKGNEERISSDEIIVVESVGSAAFDVATASHVYKHAHKSNLGTNISL